MPDYELTINNVSIIAEVKDIEMNEDEKEARQKQKKIWGSSKVGTRVRDSISKANRQLKNLTCGKLPGILIPFDTRPVPFNILDPYEIKVAMYGFETLDLSASKTFPLLSWSVGALERAKGLHQITILLQVLLQYWSTRRKLKTTSFPFITTNLRPCPYRPLFFVNLP